MIRNWDKYQNFLALDLNSMRILRNVNFVRFIIALIGILLLCDTLKAQTNSDSGQIYYQQGISFTREYKFAEGREALLKAQLWFYREKDYHSFGNTLIQLGFQTNRLGYFEESYDYFNQASEIAVSEEIPSLAFYADVAKSLTYFWEAQLTADTTLLSQGLAVLRSLNPDEYAITGEILNDYLETWGDYYLKTGNLDSARTFFNRSLAISLNDTNYLSITNCYINKAWIDLIQNKPGEALLKLDSAAKYLLSEKNYLHERRLYNVYYISFSKQKRYDKALSAYQKVMQFREKELLADRDLALSQVTNKYDRAIMEEELLLKERTLKYHKRLLLITSAMLILAIVFVILYFRLYRENRRISNKNSILLKEQNHRLKNNLQIISGLLSLQANRIQEESVRDIIEASQFRVHAIGLIHKQLYEQGGEEVELQQFANELISQIIVSFGVIKIKKDISIEKIHLPAEVVNSLGLILNELLTNSCKYAFSKTDAPALLIDIRLQEDGSIRLLYKDNGPGFNIKAAHGKSTFGITLINIQVAQLEGKSRWKGTGGLTFSVVFRVEKRLTIKERMMGKKIIAN